MMETVLILITIMVGLSSLYVSIKLSELKDSRCYIFAVAGVVNFLAVGYKLNDNSRLESKPTAIEVYQGKTKLKKTYEIVGNDTVRIDSIVIYKN